MASPSSRTDLITYAKRQLGEPVLQVNVDDEQVNNVIDDTFSSSKRTVTMAWRDVI